MLSDNLYKVRENIRSACEQSGRDEDSVSLIAVSKTRPVEMIREIYDLGVRDFGENRVQELTAKYDKLPSDIRWHLIGHLQTNKVKYIIDKVYMIHSVDSLRLAEEISKEAEKRGVTVRILIEVNVAKEESKFGVTVSGAEELIRNISVLPGLKIMGLMTVAPYVEDPDDNSTIFYNLKQLSIDIERKKIDNVLMDVLSMGMSNDYITAIKEGATHVRIGTSVFGERDYTA